MTPLLVSYSDASKLLGGISPKTIKNKICDGTLGIPVVKLGSRAFLRYSDVLALAGCAPATPIPAPALPPHPKRGRPSNAAKAARSAALAAAEVSHA